MMWKFPTKLWFRLGVCLVWTGDGIFFQPPSFSDFGPDWGLGPLFPNGTAAGFWEGASKVHEIRGELYSCASTLMAFCTSEEVPGPGSWGEIYIFIYTYVYVDIWWYSEHKQQTHTHTQISLSLYIYRESWCSIVNVVDLLNIIPIADECWYIICWL